MSSVQNDVYADLASGTVEQEKTTALATSDEQLAVATKKEKVPPLSVSDLEALLINGDLEQMGPAGRLAYYKKRCDDLGINYLTRPFDYIRVESQAIKGSYKTILYANKNCGEQLNEIHCLSHEVISKGLDPNNGSVFHVWVRVKKPVFDKDNLGRKYVVATREVDELGATAVAGLGGDKLANAQMRAVTKAKRRATLSICGVGILDETEVEAMPGVTKIAEEDLDRLSDKFRPQVGTVPPPATSSVSTTDASQTT